MSMDTWFPNPHDKDIAQLEEGLAYRAIKSGNNWILPSGKNAANGDPVVLDGVFGYATAAIVGGTDAIVEDTNWKPYGDGGALSALNSKIMIPDYSSATEVTTLNALNGTFTAPSNGYLLRRFVKNNASQRSTYELKINSIRVMYYDSDGSYRTYTFQSVPIKKGDIATVTTYTNMYEGGEMYFVPIV